MKHLVITPAYGRQYATQEEALKDWNFGKDFKIYGGPYLSNRDLGIIKADGVTKLVFAYGISPELKHFNMHL
jgi:hypothetical protein